jgi:hypothetical protein
LLFPIQDGTKDVYDDELYLDTENAINAAITWLETQTVVSQTIWKAAWPFDTAVKVFRGAIEAAHPGQGRNAEKAVNDKGENNPYGGWYHQKDGVRVSREMRMEFVEDLVYGAHDWQSEHYAKGKEPGGLGQNVGPSSAEKDLFKARIAK